jgi:hypothetical protein
MNTTEQEDTEVVDGGNASAEQVDQRDGGNAFGRMS